jgi:hypothetical protein
LIAEERAALAGFVARGFDCPERVAGKALDLLAFGDRGLRALRLPRACVGLARRFDRAFARRAEIYLHETARRLATLDLVLDGAEPRWEAEPEAGAGHGGFWHHGCPQLPASVFEG